MRNATKPTRNIVDSKPVVIEADVPETEVKFVSGVDGDGNVTAGFQMVPKAKPLKGDHSDIWRTLPIPVLMFISTAWKGWKDKSAGCSDSSLTLDGFDYECKVYQYGVPVLAISKRVNSNLRSSMQVQLAKLQSEKEDLEATKAPVVAQIKGIEDLLIEVESAKKTNSDPDWIKVQEDALEGWDKTVADLTVHIGRINESLEANEAKTCKLLSVNLNMVEEWTICLGDIE
jgi:hypothetical protein